jgi:hypothetical protein
MLIYYIVGGGYFSHIHYTHKGSYNILLGDNDTEHMDDVGAEAIVVSDCESDSTIVENNNTDILINNNTDNLINNNTDNLINNNTDNLINNNTDNLINI